MIYSHYRPIVIDRALLLSYIDEQVKIVGKKISKMLGNKSGEEILKGERNRKCG
jgi:hypothetical protein